jgi:lysophospholipase L1-like esterase
MAGTGCVGGVGLTALLAREVLRLQARSARGTIGNPLGEEAHLANRTYKKKYGNPIDLLLVGDSIAAGLGADKPSHTLGAQLAKRLAKRTQRSVRLHTAAHVGAETSMLRAQLAGLPPGYAADVAVIVVGGNDVTHRMKTTTSKQQLAEVVDTLRKRRTHVVVGTCPDLGALQALPQPLRILARITSRQLAEAQRDVATRLGAHAVSLADVVGPFFIAQPDQMLAIDRFHPSSAGYRRTAKALLPSILATLGHKTDLPYGHHPPAPTTGADHGAE